MDITGMMNQSRRVKPGEDRISYRPWGVTLRPGYDYR
jgi:hypothetical protein